MPCAVIAVMATAESDALDGLLQPARNSRVLAQLRPADSSRPVADATFLLECFEMVFTGFMRLHVFVDQLRRA